MKSIQQQISFRIDIEELTKGKSEQSGADTDGRAELYQMDRLIRMTL